MTIAAYPTYSKSLFSYNPIPNDCVLYIPAFHNSIRGPVFKSVDPFGHTVTVTGATKVDNGFSFDGADDIITIPDVVSIQNIFDGGGTIVGIMKAAGMGEANTGTIANKGGKWILRLADLSASTHRMRFFPEFSGDAGSFRTTTRVFTLGTKHHFAMTYDADDAANVPSWYADGASTGNTTVVTPTGTRTSDVANDLDIGNNAITTQTFDGVLIEHWFYNRVLSADEISHHYRMTRGR